MGLHGLLQGQLYIFLCIVLRNFRFNCTDLVVITTTFHILIQGDARFESRLVHRLSWLISLVISLCSLQANIRTVHRLSYERFLPNPFQFVFYKWTCLSTLYIVGNNSFAKCTIKLFYCVIEKAATVHILHNYALHFIVLCWAYVTLKSVSSKIFQI
jgi:hypothetical protein